MHLDFAGYVGLVDNEVLEYMVRCREEGRPLPRYRPRPSRPPWHSRTATASNSSAFGELCCQTL